jgi:hypothetical protein
MPANSDENPSSSLKGAELQDRARKKRAAVVKPRQNWRSVVGMLGDSPFEREAWALGEAWRQDQKEP